MFEVYTKEFELNGEKYKIYPLTGKFIGKLYGCVTKLGIKEGMTEAEASESLNGDAMGDLYEIALETFKQSYPDQKEETLSQFVAQNLVKLIQPIIEVNITPKVN